jgi:hypothetical protein
MQCRFLTQAINLLAGLTLFHSAYAGSPVGMNDVTLIYPLPFHAQETVSLISPQAQGLGGPLLPQRHFARLPAINQGEARHLTYQTLRVVAVRLDPCFPFKGQCLPQIRLVWQPLKPSSYGSSTRPGVLEAKDAAIHSLYTLDPDTFRSMLDDYDALRRAHGMDLSGMPLQVHPVLRQQGFDGDFAKGLKALLAKYAGERNLWRVTAMSTFVGGDQWAFQGFNVRDNDLQEIAIPRTQGATQQRFSLSSLSKDSYRNAKLSPLPSGVDNLQLLLNDSRALRAGGAPLVRELGVSVARIENPDIHTPESMDCVSCHAAQTAGLVLFNRFPWLRQDAHQGEVDFRDPQSLPAAGPRQANTQILRALGYFERQLVMSRRVINETAKVVESLNRRAS